MGNCLEGQEVQACSLVLQLWLSKTRRTSIFHCFYSTLISVVLVRLSYSLDSIISPVVQSGGWCLDQWSLAFSWARSAGTQGGQTRGQGREGRSWRWWRSQGEGIAAVAVSSGPPLHGPGTASSRTVCDYREEGKLNHKVLYNNSLIPRPHPLAVHVWERNDITWHHKTSHDSTRHHMTSHDTTWSHNPQKTKDVLVDITVSQFIYVPKPLSS